MNIIKKRQNRIKRHKRASSGLMGTKDRPRVNVFRSNKHIYAQFIDDINHTTLLAMTDKDILKGTKSEKASELGKTLGKKALESKIKSVIFDRGGYKYHGRVKAFSEGLREAGLQF